MEEKIIKSFRCEKGVIFELKNSNGCVHVAGCAGDSAEIRAVKRLSIADAAGVSAADEKLMLDEVIVEALFDGRMLSVETKRLNKDSKVTVDYDILLPSSVRVEKIVNSNGKISIENASGGSHLETSNGRIDAKSVDGTINAYSSNGGIFIVKASGVANVETSNGPIEVEFAEVVGGVSLKTSNGKIALRLPDGADVDVEMKTSNGGISVSGIGSSKANRFSDRFECRLGRGGNLVRAVTSNGKIELMVGGNAPPVKLS